MIFTIDFPLANERESYFNVSSSQGQFISCLYMSEKKKICVGFSISK